MEPTIDSACVCEISWVPMDSEKYSITELKEADTTIFLKGELIKFFNREKVRIPSLAHA